MPRWVGPRLLRWQRIDLRWTWWHWVKWVLVAHCCLLPIHCPSNNAYWRWAVPRSGSCLGTANLAASVPRILGCGWKDRPRLPGEGSRFLVIAHSIFLRAATAGFVPLSLFLVGQAYETRFDRSICRWTPSQR